MHILIRTALASNIGRCRKCMRQSLFAALSAWAFFGLGLLAWPDGLARDLIGIGAMALTALWLVHVGTYAARALVEARGGDEQPLRAPVIKPSAQARVADAPIGRRQALAVLMRSAGIGVVASVPMLVWPDDSFAFCGQCTKNADCGVGFVCKNTAPVNSGKVCNECVRA